MKVTPVRSGSSRAAPLMRSTHGPGQPCCPCRRAAERPQRAREAAPRRQPQQSSLRSIKVRACLLQPLQICHFFPGSICQTRKEARSPEFSTQLVVALPIYSSRKFYLQIKTQHLIPLSHLQEFIFLYHFFTCKPCHGLDHMVME